MDTLSIIVIIEQCTASSSAINISIQSSTITFHDPSRLSITCHIFSSFPIPFLGHSLVKMLKLDKITNLLISAKWTTWCKSTNNYIIVYRSFFGYNINEVGKLQSPKKSHSHKLRKLCHRYFLNVRKLCLGIFCLFPVDKTILKIINEKSKASKKKKKRLV